MQALHRATQRFLTGRKVLENVGDMEEFLIEDEHAEHLSFLLKAGLEFLEQAGKRRTLLTFPAEQEAVSRQLERLGFPRELTILRAKT